MFIARILISFCTFDPVVANIRADILFLFGYIVYKRCWEFKEGFTIYVVSCLRGFDIANVSYILHLFVVYSMQTEEWICDVNMDCKVVSNMKFIPPHF